MQSVKEVLRNAIEELTEEQARQVLYVVHHLQSQNGAASALARLAGHPALTIPPNGFAKFQRVEPIRAPGVPASKLLIEDRYEVAF